MKRLKNYFRSLELIKVEEKKISKEVRNAAKDSTALKTFFSFTNLFNYWKHNVYVPSSF